MEKECQERLDEIKNSFHNVKRAFTSLGDETRQVIISVLLENDLEGLRVGEIAKHTYLSRPAVSHHLQVLKDAGIINMRREGTRNFYYIDADNEVFKQLYILFDNINKNLKHLKRGD